MIHRRLFLTISLFHLLGTAAFPQARREIILATTTSTYDSGLLDSLVPPFEHATGIRVKIIAVGTGAALAMAGRGDADVVLVHAPARELALVRAGDLVHGALVMHNDFVLAGPAGDPARVRRCPDLTCAMRAVAARGSFVSRGDRSGTHDMELALWHRAGVSADSVRSRIETGQGMGATLDVTRQRQAYTLTDRGTLLAHPAGRELAIVFQGDPILLNIYHVHVVNPARHPRVEAAAAQRFRDYLVSAPAQRAIGRFGRARYGQPLFIPDAGRDSTRLHETRPGE